jgi:hypothetical protein
MNREDEIRKRLEKIEADPGQGTPIRLVYPIDQSAADLRYLLEKVERLERERLVFVSAEEAAKWPDEVPVIARRMQRNGRPVYATVNCLYPDILRSWIDRSKMTAFARLPETLPELEGNDG